LLLGISTISAISMRYRFKNLAARFQGKIEMESTLKAGLPRVRFETLRSGKSMLS